ncbi:hypothetical protein TNCV_3284881 [Trichonephila clavipes]|nr:hypothetical protein TNCV_3284881 [Trichonephila clavipes]
MCDTLHHLAAAKILFITVQKGYEFRNDVYVDGRSWISLASTLDFFSAISTSATFVFTKDARPHRFLSAIDPVSRNRCTKCVIFDAFGDVSLGYFC